MHILEKDNLLPSHQSVYRKLHSTETATLKITSDALQAADHSDITLLGLLVAFYMINQNFLIDLLQAAFGICGSVLPWIDSFKRGQTQTNHFNGQPLTRLSVDCSMPHGSVLGPILFLLYTADVILITE